MSCSDCFSSSDLLCGEDSSFVNGDDSPKYASDLDSLPPEFEDSIAELLEEERGLAGVTPRLSREPIDYAARADSVAWILKGQGFHGFQPLTAYLSVNYLDRFLHSHPLPEANGWPLQLLSVACLSLAAKLEEPLVPSLLDLQVDAKFIFEPRTIKRMELLVLTVLDWRLRSISPFCYLTFFALKIDPSGTCSSFLASKAKEIILSAIKGASFIKYRPSCVAAAAALCAANDLPNVSFAESWRDGLQLHKDDFKSCYQMIREISLKAMGSRQTKVMPQLRVMSMINSSDSCSSSSSPYKRRKLNSELWGEEDKRGSG